MGIEIVAPYAGHNEVSFNFGTVLSRVPGMSRRKGADLKTEKRSLPYMKLIVPTKCGMVGSNAQVLLGLGRKGGFMANIAKIVSNLRQGDRTAQANERAWNLRPGWAPSTHIPFPAVYMA